MAKTKSILGKSILLVLILSQVITSALGQGEEIKESRGFYYYQNAKYKIQDLEPILANQPQAFTLFIEGKRRLKIANILGIISLVEVGVGVFSFASIQEPNNPLEAVLLTSVNAELRTMGSLLVGGGIICGIFSLTNRTSGIKMMDNAIQIFNSKNIPPGLQSNLRFGLTGNGIGLVLGF